jgi:hypothetical protein
MSKRTLEYDRDAILGLLRNLNQLVVSLDRIGSSAADMSREETNATLKDFISEWGVLGKLAQARRVLSEPFSDEPGPDGMDELEREMQAVEYWSFSRRLPAKDA